MLTAQGFAAKNKKTRLFQVWFLWRRRGDSNPRTVLPAYSLSRGAPYSHLGTSAWLQVWVNYEVVGDFKWRREWDSNPRLLRVTGFQDRLLKPLGHLSSSFSIRGECYLSTFPLVCQQKEGNLL